MTRVYIDCEWNGFDGELISMALVSECGQEFYEVLHCESPEPWVAENVIPILQKTTTTMVELQVKLQSFLARFDAVHVVADWPEDIERFCAALITGPGQRIDTPPLSISIFRIDAGSELPHNALYDARGMRDHFHPGG